MSTGNFVGHRVQHAYAVQHILLSLCFFCFPSCPFVSQFFPRRGPSSFFCVHLISLAPKVVSHVSLTFGVWLYLLALIFPLVRFHSIPDLCNSLRFHARSSGTRIFLPTPFLSPSSLSPCSRRIFWLKQTDSSTDVQTFLKQLSIFIRLFHFFSRSFYVSWCV